MISGTKYIYGFWIPNSNCNSDDPLNIHESVLPQNDEIPNEANYNQSSASYSMNPDNLNETCVSVEANKEKIKAENEVFVDSLFNKKSKKVKKPNHEVTIENSFEGIHNTDYEGQKVFRKKDFKCETCGKTFTQSGSLKVHIRTVHEGQKNYECTMCSKAFGQSGDLSRHVKKIHGISKNDPLLLI